MLCVIAMVTIITRSILCLWDNVKLAGCFYALRCFVKCRILFRWMWIKRIYIRQTNNLSVDTDYKDVNFCLGLHVSWFAWSTSAAWSVDFQRRTNCNSDAARQRWCYASIDATREMSVRCFFLPLQLLQDKLYRTCPVLAITMYSHCLSVSDICHVECILEQ